jgi:hypothetical protein
LLKPSQLNVRFGPNATEMLPGAKMTRCAKSAGSMSQHGASVRSDVPPMFSKFSNMTGNKITEAKKLTNNAFRF